MCSLRLTSMKRPERRRSERRRLPSEEAVQLRLGDNPEPGSGHVPLCTLLSESVLLESIAVSLGALLLS
jgi:hypothetical protein